MSPAAESAARRVAREMGLDGQRFTAPDGRSLAEVCGVPSDELVGGCEVFEFDDGSAIVVCDGRFAWDVRAKHCVCGICWESVGLRDSCREATRVRHHRDWDPGPECVAYDDGPCCGLVGVACWASLIDDVTCPGCRLVVYRRLCEQGEPTDESELLLRLWSTTADELLLAATESGMCSCGATRAECADSIWPADVDRGSIGLGTVETVAQRYARELEAQDDADRESEATRMAAVETSQYEEG